MTKSINQRMIEALKKEHISCDFEVIRFEAKDAKTANYMARYVAGVMNTRDDDEENPFDPLELKKYMADDGDYIADVLITCGGPTCSVRYESRKGTAVVSFKWGHDYLDVETENAPITALIEQLTNY